MLDARPTCVTRSKAKKTTHPLTGLSQDIMKLLIVSPRFPYPASTADRLTVYQLLRYLSQRHTIDLFACSDKPVTRSQSNAVAPFCRAIHTVHISQTHSVANSFWAMLRLKPIQSAWFYTRRAQRMLQALVRAEDYDVLYAHTIRAGRYVTDLKPKPNGLHVLAMQISMRLNYERLAVYERNLIYRLAFKHEAARLRIFESRISEQFDRALVISDVDRSAINNGSTERFFECPHGVTLDDVSPHSVERDTNMIVFSGRMDYRPNVDAALFFCHEILPYIRAVVPNALVYIVGARPDASVRELDRIDGVTVTGEVDEIYPWLRRASVGVDPLRAGAGLQNKVLEGMACGLPMVVTPVANEGIKAEPGVHLLTADTPSTFASKVIQLLGNADLRRRIGAAGRRFIEEHWTWQRHFHRLEWMLESDSQAKRATGRPASAPVA